MFYSANKNTWYEPAWRADYEATASWPADAVEYPFELFAATVSNRPSGKKLAPDENGHPVLVDLPEPLVTADGLCSGIDAAADAARRAVAGDPLRAVEYEKAAAEAQAFKVAGYPAANIPRTVSAWAINGRTAQQAADNILLEAAQYNEALYCIRETRLQAKELVRQAMAANNVAHAQDIAAETIAAIKGAVTGIGNNPS